MRFHPAAVPFLAACALAACNKSPEPAAPAQSVAADAEPASVVLAKSGINVVPGIAKASRDWAGEPFSDSTRYDNDIKTYRRVIMYSHGTVAIDRTDDGELKMVVLSSGAADRCGSVKGVLLGVDALLSQIGQSTLTDAERATLSPGGELIRNGVLVRTVKGCVWNAVVRSPAGPQ